MSFPIFVSIWGEKDNVSEVWFHVIVHSLILVCIREVKKTLCIGRLDLESRLYLYLFCVYFRLELFFKKSLTGGSRKH